MIRGFAERRKARKASYSQSGEDVIIDYIFTSMKLWRPAYIDVGAHDPFYLNNTMLFYEKGCRGVNVEPNPALLDRFLKYRPGDVNVCMGVAGAAGELDFYRMSAPSMGTFSREEAERLDRETSVKIVGAVKVKVETLPALTARHFGGAFPDLLSLDVEGLELEILRTIDYEKAFPTVICVETLTYSENRTERKDGDIIDFILSRGYMLYADTYINSIFVRETAWKGR